jgi:ribonucleotide reductase alpha subunit
VSDHVIHLQTYGDAELEIWCSCGTALEQFRLGVTTLDLVNEIAHEHIETAEAEVINRDAINDERLGRTEAYRTTSAVTSNDELVDLGET